tara:strand:+ start:4431 stop:5129 length:699 start_codon:yes stop_codon:yes gene_type:complete
MEGFQEGGANMDIIQKNTFVQHMFNFDEDTKTKLLNQSQYVVLAIIPVYIIGVIIETFIPDYDESKGNIEVFIEVILQVMLLIGLVHFTHNLITYIPTYSGKEYDDINFVTVILSIMFMYNNVDTKFSKKINLLKDRLNEMWGGKAQQVVEKKDETQVKVSQPISKPLPPTLPTHHVSRADYLNTPAVNSNVQVNIPDEIHQPQIPNNQMVANLNSFDPAPAGLDSGFGSAW